MGRKNILRLLIAILVSTIVFAVINNRAFGGVADILCKKQFNTETGFMFKGSIENIIVCSLSPNVDISNALYNIRGLHIKGSYNQRASNNFYFGTNHQINIFWDSFNLISNFRFLLCKSIIEVFGKVVKRCNLITYINRQIPCWSVSAVCPTREKQPCNFIIAPHRGIASTSNFFKFNIFEENKSSLCRSQCGFGNLGTILCGIGSLLSNSEGFFHISGLFLGDLPQFSSGPPQGQGK